MSQPTPYNQSFSFTDFAASNPFEQQPGAQMDAELAAVELTIDQVLARLVLIQRDDGALANESVGEDQLEEGLLATLMSGVTEEIDDFTEEAQAAATAAQAAQAAAEAARDATLAAYDNFDDRYLGAKAANPTLDNDGNALVGGALYWNSVAQEMRLWTGSAWVAAYVSGAGYLAASANLSDLANAATARTNLGLGSAALSAASAFEPALPSKTGNALKHIRVNAGENAWELAAEASSAWTQIATVTPGAVAQVDFTSIPTTYQDLLVVFRGLSHTAGAGGTAIQTQLSANNGSSWSAAANISPALTAAITADGAMLIPRYRGDSGAFFSALAGTGSSPDAIAATSSPGGWRITGGINALRILIATGNFDAGTITLYGK